MMKNQAQTLATDARPTFARSSNVSVRKVHVCPVCGDEVSFSTVGIGHICKRESASTGNRDSVLSSKVLEGPTKIEDNMGSSLPNSNQTTRKGMDRKTSLQTSKKLSETEGQNSSGDSELEERMSKDKSGESIISECVLPEKVSYNNFINVLPSPIQRNIRTSQTVVNPTDKKVAKTTSLYLSGHNYATKDSNDGQSTERGSQLKKEVPVLKCTPCKMSFSSKSTLQRHLKSVHAEEKNGRIRSKVDGANTDMCAENVSENDPHDLSELEENNQMAEEKTDSVESAMDKSTKEIESHHCQICDKVFGKLGNLEEHLFDVHNVIRKYKCPFCQKIFQFHHKLREHKLSHKTYTCKVCKKIFSTAQNLKRHFKRHAREKPFTCELCGAKFLALKLYEEHLNSHSGESPFVGDHCGKESGISSSYDRQIPGGRKRNKVQFCKICGKKLKSVQSFKEHMNSHSGAKPYVCSTCGMSFGRISCRDRHMKLHSAMKTHSCETCGKKFRSKNYLSMHLRIHTGEKPYKCNICDRTFTMATNCRLHIKRHAKEKRYKCNYCNKAFTASFTLNEHLRIHTGEKPFQCLYCSEAFSTQVLWRSHIYTHTGEMAYQCRTCNKCFIHGPSLNKHLNKTGHEGGRNPKVLSYAECVQQGKIKPTQNKDASLEVENAVTNLSPGIDSDTTQVNSTTYQMIQISSPMKQHHYTDVQREVVITSSDLQETVTVNTSHSQNQVVALTHEDIIIEDNVDDITLCEENMVTLDTLAGVACKDLQISDDRNIDNSQNDKKDVDESNHSVSVEAILPSHIVDKNESNTSFDVNIVHLGNDSWCLSDKSIYVCDLCKKGFVYESRLQTHFCAAKDENGNYECVDCAKTFVEKILLQLHMLVHKQDISKSKNHV